MKEIRYKDPIKGLEEYQAQAAVPAVPVSPN